jgi:hypothetical protein
MVRQAPTLAAAGFEFVYRDGRYVWTHPAELRPSDLIATHMDDKTFSLFVQINALTQPTNRATT